MSAALQHITSGLSTTIGTIAFNPIVSAFLLYLLTKAPLRLRRLTIDRISLLRDPIVLRKVIKSLKWCVALGLTGVANRAGNHAALNAGRWTTDKKRWKWNEEIAVVTGGCSGIGELVVKRLVGRGVRVVVLDVVDGLSGGLKGCKFQLFFFFSVWINDICETTDKM